MLPSVYERDADFFRLGQEEHLPSGPVAMSRLLAGRRRGAWNLTLAPLARRAQAEHNIMFESNRPTEGRKLLDPALSALGRDQAAALCQDPLVGNPGANLKSISHRCHLFELAFV